MITEEQHQEWKKDLIELHKLRIENKKLREACKDLLTRLEKTTKYLEIRTKKQSKYSIPRLVDKIIEANRAAIAKEKG